MIRTAGAALALLVLARGGVVSAAAPAPSPLVALACDTAGTYDIYVARVDGTQLRAVTSGARSDTAPAWSPDGRHLVFWSALAGASELTVVAVADGARRVLSLAEKPDNPHRIFPPDWSPDGRWIVFESNRDAAAGANRTDLYRIRPDGSGLERLTDGGGITAAPGWAADSRAMVLSRQFGSGGSTTFPELFVRQGDGSERRLTEDVWHDWDATWAPDGRRLAFMSNRGSDGGAFGIHLRHADGRTTPVAGGATGSYAGSPSWTGDGRWLAYEYDPDGKTEPSVGYFGGTDVRAHIGGPQRSRVHLVRPDGTGDRAVTDGSSSCTTPSVLRRR